MALDKQVQVYSVDTGNFYSNREARLHNLNHKLKLERNNIKKDILFAESYLSLLGFDEKQLKEVVKGNFENAYIIGDSFELSALIEYYRLNWMYKHKSDLIKKSKNELLSLLNNKVESNISSNGKHHIRTLRFLDKHCNETEPNPANIISVFDSSFTRMIGAKQDELCEDFMVVQVYYFDVAKDIIYHGFEYKGEKYIYFTSSAGQIRTKKLVVVKESIWNKYQKELMCGLTVDTINEKGGCNVNKYLAYLALSNSATDVWKEFDIDKCIVIDDFETDVHGTYDFIDDTDYSITRMDGEITITHTDGCGMMLPFAFNRKQKNMMVRLPWIKGLIGVFDFLKFIEVNNCSPVIKDIYGVEHDVIKEDIQVILTKSQFKMWKYYSSWEQYKEYFMEYHCSAGFTNMEEDRIKNATINYQMLQSLTDITDDEIYAIAKQSIEKLNNICSSVDTVKDAFGATPYNTYMTPLQKAICLYPELLNDVYIRNKLKDIKDSLMKKYKSGKLEVKGKYTFLLPDLYASCEYWFLNEKNPKGLLQDGEVFCWLFRKSDKLDCLRSPHLYKEHAVRENLAYCEFDNHLQIRKWFITDAVYTSCHDLISKILMFDVDGDKSLVVADKEIVSVAERNMEKIVPLFYNMKKALPSHLDYKNIYDGLIHAFIGGNIGIYSNNISKIWNSETFISGTEEEKLHAIDCVKRLCCQNNFVIDYAKTLYKPEFPDKIKDEIQNYTKKNVPHFFIYAKDKTDYQVEDANGSFINKLEKLIPNPRISCKYVDDNGKNQKLQKPNYLFLMYQYDETINVEHFLKKYKDVIDKYIEYAKKYYLKIDAMSDKPVPIEVLRRTAVREKYVYGKIRDEVKKGLSSFGYSDIEIADILVQYLYGIKENKYKDMLWICYGEQILSNLEKNIRTKTKYIQCIDCGEWFEVNIKNNKTIRCESCTKEHYNKYQRDLMREKRAINDENDGC